MNKWNMSVAVLVGAAMITPAFAGDVDPKVEALVAQIATQVDGAAAASAETKTYVKKYLLPYCTNSVFVKEVKAQNAKGRSLDEIKSIDKEWVDAEDVLPIHEEMMGNATANEIRKAVKELGVVGETFVMDNQGANVGQNELTSDFWQGDEAKWSKAFVDGKGGVDFGKEKLDKSTNAVDQKVSLPIIDEKGTVIGAVCFGIKPEKVALALASE